MSGKDDRSHRVGLEREVVELLAFLLTCNVPNYRAISAVSVMGPGWALVIIRYSVKSLLIPVARVLSQGDDAELCHVATVTTGNEDLSPASATNNELCSYFNQFDLTGLRDCYSNP